MAIRWIGNELNEFRNQQLDDSAALAHERRMAWRQHEADMLEKVEGLKGRNALDLEARRGENALSLAEKQGEWGVRQQSEANKAAAAQAEVKRQQQQDQIAATLERARIQAGGRADAAKSAQQARIISSAINAGAAGGKDAAQVLAELATTYQNDQEMLSAIAAVGGGQKQGVQGQGTQNDIQTDAQGKKWRIVRDADGKAIGRQPVQ